MADKGNVLAAGVFFPSLVALAPTIQCLRLLFCTLLIERSNLTQLTLNVALEYKRVSMGGGFYGKLRDGILVFLWLTTNSFSLLPLGPFQDGKRYYYENC